MKTGAVSKLVALRQKTDRELLIVVGRELERGLALAHVAATVESPLYEEAVKIREQTEKLLPTIAGVDPRERETLDAAIREVRLALNRVPAGKRLQLCVACTGD